MVAELMCGFFWTTNCSLINLAFYIFCPVVCSFWRARAQKKNPLAAAKSAVLLVAVVNTAASRAVCPLLLHGFCAGAIHCYCSWRQDRCQNAFWLVKLLRWQPAPFPAPARRSLGKVKKKKSVAVFLVGALVSLQHQEASITSKNPNSLGYSAPTLQGSLWTKDEASLSLTSYNRTQLLYLCQ